VIRINAYEIMLMIDPDVAEERHQEIIERVKSTVTQAGGSWNGVDPWGKRKLAYEIEHHADAWYFVLSFDAPAEALAEATRVLAITDGVMRHMAVNRPKASSGRAAEPHPEPVQAGAER
jgi:small subunit ribosomal protein S6